MDFSTTHTAKSYEIFFRVASQTTSLLDAMDLEIFRTSASLPSPAIAVEYALAKPLIGIPVQANSRIS
jgi:hypothetical protein